MTPADQYKAYKTEASKDAGRVILTLFVYIPVGIVVLSVVLAAIY